MLKKTLFCCIRIPQNIDFVVFQLFIQQAAETLPEMKVSGGKAL